MSLTTSFLEHLLKGNTHNILNEWELRLLRSRSAAQGLQGPEGPLGDLTWPPGPSREPGSPDASKGEKSTRYHTKRSHMELIRGIFTFFRLLSRREFANWLGNGGRRAVRGKSRGISVFAHTHTHTHSHNPRLLACAAGG